MLVREDLAEGGFIAVRDLPVIKHPVIILIDRITGFRFHRPFVLIGSVVEDKIHGQGDAGFAEFRSQLFQLGDRSQAFFDVPVR